MYNFRRYLANKFYGTAKYISNAIYKIGTSLGVILPPCEDKLVQYVDVEQQEKFFPDETGVLIDLSVEGSGSEVGREGQNGAYLNGNGTAYINVLKSDGTAFTDADLPANFKVEFCGKYNEALNTGFFGSFTSPPSRFFFRSSTTQGNFVVGIKDIFDPSSIVSTGLSIGDDIEITIDVTSSSFSVSVNGTSYITDQATTGFFSGAIVQILAFASGAQSNHNCHSFTITNTDTNEVIMQFNFEESNTDNKVIGVSPNGPVVGEIQNATGADRVSTTDRRSYLDDNGYVIAYSKSLSSQELEQEPTRKSFVIEPNLSYSLLFDGIENATSWRHKLFFYKNDVLINDVSIENKVNYQDSNTVFNYRPDVNDSILSSSNGTGKHVYWNNIDADRVDVALQFGDTSASTITVGNKLVESLFYITSTTEPIPSGVKIPVLNGTTQAYLADGTQPSALSFGGFSGPLKANLRVVDGEVDLDSSDKLGNITNFTSNTDYQIIGTDEIRISNSVAGTFQRSRLTINGLANGDVTFVLKAESLQGTYTPYMEFRTLSGAFLTSATFSVENVDNRIKVTVIDGGLIVDFWVTIGASGAELGEKRYYDFRLYEGDYVTGSPPLPASGEAVSGNSLIQNETKYDVVQADLLTTVQMFNHTDPDNVVAIPVAVDDFIADDNDVRFTKFDVDGGIDKQGLYSEALVSPCLEEVQDFFDVHIPYRVYNDVTGEYDAYVTDGLIYNVKAGS